MRSLAILWGIMRSLAILCLAIVGFAIIGAGIGAALGVGGSSGLFTAAQGGSIVGFVIGGAVGLVGWIVWIVWRIVRLARRPGKPEEDEVIGVRPD